MAKRRSSSVAKPWDYLRNGEYREAIEAYSALLKTSEKSAHYMNRGLAYLNLREHVAALRDFRRILSIENPRTWAESYFIMQAVCYWWLDGPYEAIAIMRHAVIAPYTHFGGALAPALLVYMAERLNDAGIRREAIALLRKHGRHRYPSPVTLLLLGTIDDGQYYEAMPSSNTQLIQARHRCQWDFYSGVRALREGNLDLFTERMTQCGNNPYGLAEDERYFALWEIDRHFAAHPFRGRIHWIPDL
jgi:hypothetical protein